MFEQIERSLSNLWKKQRYRFQRLERSVASGVTDMPKAFRLRRICRGQKSLSLTRP